MILRPSLHPSSRSRWRNAAVHSLWADAAPEPSNPMTGTGDCSARVAEGHATAALLNSVMNSRRLMPDLGISPALVPSRAFYRRVSLRQRCPQVLGADLNCSESKR